MGSKHAACFACVVRSAADHLARLLELDPLLQEQEGISASRATGFTRWWWTRHPVVSEDLRRRDSRSGVLVGGGGWQLDSRLPRECQGYPGADDREVLVLVLQRLAEALRKLVQTEPHRQVH